MPHPTVFACVATGDFGEARLRHDVWIHDPHKVGKRRLYHRQHRGTSRTKRLLVIILLTEEVPDLDT